MVAFRILTKIGRLYSKVGEEFGSDFKYVKGIYNSPRFSASCFFSWIDTICRPKNFFKIRFRKQGASGVSDTADLLSAEYQTQLIRYQGVSDTADSLSAESQTQLIRYQRSLRHS